MKLLLAVGALAVVTAPQALAWGDEGHRIVCAIAYHEAAAATRAKIDGLLAANGESGPFSETCLFADHPRTRNTEHYVNLPRNASGLGTTPCPLASTCVVSAIEADMTVLSNPARSDADRLTALEYLGHWVGDVHQPLHVSFEDDRGGNSVNMTGTCHGNLHGAWDSCLLEQAVGTDIAAAVNDLTAEITMSEGCAWIASKPIDWANESFAITTAAQTGYCVEVGGVCEYQAGNEQLDPGEPKKMVTIDAAYVAASTPVVRDRLKRAGVRLAQMLNEALVP